MWDLTSFFITRFLYFSFAIIIYESKKNRENVQLRGTDIALSGSRRNFKMQNSSYIIVLGGDGYLGWPLSLRLARRNPFKKIILVDNLLRRKLVDEVGGCSLIPILDSEKRLQEARKIYALNNLQFLYLDINSEELDILIRESQPEAIYHLAQQCSAPYSMRGCSEALFTLNNNEGGNMRLLWAVRNYAPNCHIIKLGSFGEYAKSGIEISEGYFEPEFRGKRAQRPIPYPREADDFYHASKINDTNYISIACRKWGLRITDVMQSTVFGSWTEDIDGHSTLYTRMDYDETFGTVANRFMIQALAGKPLSIYGSGHQRTGLMALNDCIESLSDLWSQLPPLGTHRVINHLTEECYSINELAQTIKDIADQEGFKVEIQRGVHDPRKENDPVKLEYSIERQHVHRSLKPTPLREIVSKTFKMILPYQSCVNVDCLFPVTLWDQQKPYKNLNISDNFILPGRESVAAVSCEPEWENYRLKHFPSSAVNLNPGTLGTPSVETLEAMKKFNTADILSCPREQYKKGLEALQAAADTAEKIWPSSEHALHIAPSATQAANLLALTLARVSALRQRPLRVLTTSHEHLGGVGSFKRLREFELIYLSEREMRDLNAFHNRISLSKPDIAFFSHITFDCGQVLPVSEWSDIIKSLHPDALVILDISQSLGLLPPSFGQADVLFSSGHKWLFGPRGSGLLWTNENFRKVVGALHWSGDSFATGIKNSGFNLSGGMDFSVFAGLEAALKLHQKTGVENIRNRGIQLKHFFRQSLSGLLQKYDIQGDIIQSGIGIGNEVGILALMFENFDPYPLYMAMNKIKLYCKCIKDEAADGKPRQILRFGFPYYETKSRLESSLTVLDQFMSEKFSDGNRRPQLYDSEIKYITEPPVWSQPQTL